MYYITSRGLGGTVLIIVGISFVITIFGTKMGMVG